jgi:thiamine biosynthesis lipoprotein
MNPRRFAMLLLGIVGATVGRARAEEPLTLAGPAFGTTYRVTLARPIPGLTGGEVHRELERVLATIDQAASTWREDSDASRFNAAGAGEWITVADELATIVAIARGVHEASRGAFDITVPAGMQFLELRREAGRASLRKLRAGLRLDLGGIGPGYAVDRLGARLCELSSPAHLVELGGEVRGWGVRMAGEPWRVRLMHAGLRRGGPIDVELAPGEAVATSTRRPDGSHVDPRSGRPVTAGALAVTVRAASCAEADAWAVAAIVLGLDPGDGILSLSDIERQLAAAHPPAATE